MIESTVQPGPLNPDAEPAEHEEALLLMSLAMDGLLDDDDALKLHTMLASDSALRATFERWQRLDTALAATPRALPADGFVHRFDERVRAEARKARSRRRVAFGIAMLFSWGWGLALLWLLGSTLYTNQGDLAHGYARELTYALATMRIAASATSSSLAAMLGEPQSAAIICGYAATALLFIYLWVRLLRRTVHNEVIS